MIEFLGDRRNILNLIISVVILALGCGITLGLFLALEMIFDPVH